MTTVAVVGGGLAGLVAAYDLQTAGAQVTVFERDGRIGGQISSVCAGGFLIEHGAEGYATAQAAGHDLCRDLHISDRLVSQSTKATFELREGRLVPTPPGRAAQLVGIQADQGDLGRGITSLVGGMAELTGALRAALPDAHVQVGTAVLSLEPLSAGWAIGTAAGGTFRADAVVLAAPARDASRLLREFAPGAAETLEDFPAVSSVTVSLAFQRSAVAHALDGAGFVSAAGPEAPGFRACSFVSSQFPARAAPGHVLVRVFFRPGPQCPLDAPDSRWVDEATGHLCPVLGITGDPVGAWVARWRDALPRFGPGHEARVAAVAREAGRPRAPLVLAGAAYRRAGVAGAIASARAAARELRLAAGA